MTQQQGNKDVTLDDLLRIVESAARTIERLQAVNTSLMQQIRDAETKARQLDELEKSEAALREDAEWCRWFKGKYGASTFFSHIEREYQCTQRADDSAPRAPQSGIAPDAS